MIISCFSERDAFDTLLDHAPDKLNVVKKVKYLKRDSNLQKALCLVPSYFTLFLYLSPSVPRHLCEQTPEQAEPGGHGVGVPG
jgi:hypothetical protein